MRDTVSSSIITRALYRANDAKLDTCTSTGCLTSLEKGAHIRLTATASGSLAKLDTDGLTLLKGTNTVISVNKNGTISSPLGALIEARTDGAQRTLILDVSLA